MKTLKLVSDLTGVSLHDLTDKHYLELEGHSEVNNFKIFLTQFIYKHCFY